MSRKEDTEHDAAVLWDFVAVHNPHRCQARHGLAMSDARIRSLSKYLLRETGQQVILPTGMSEGPHTDPFGEPCRCGKLKLNYSAVTAKAWYQRRLKVALGHATSVFEIGDNIALQFPESHIMTRLVSDARRVKEDLELALAWMAEE